MLRSHHRRARREGHHAVHHVTKLTHVAGPCVRHEPLDGVRSQDRRCLVGLPESREEEACEGDHVLRALAERRDLQRNDLEADFFGPGATLSAIFGERFFARVRGGKPGESFGDPDMLHSYSYVPDVVSGLLALGTSSSADGVYMLPVQPAEATRAVIERCYRVLGKSLGVARVPTWALRMMGLFDPSIRELVEMIYQWEQPFVVDDTRLRTELGVAATPWDDAIAATAAWGSTLA